MDNNWMESFEDMQKLVKGQTTLSINDLDPDRSVLVISDMIKGFTEFGSLSSQRVGLLSEPVVALAQRLDALAIESVAFADAHSKESPEFESYPVHCLAGSNEAELIEGLQAIKHMHLVHKNSTNGFLEPEFQRLLRMNPDWQTFLIVGNCTDICVLQLALSLKAHFNRMDLPVDICVAADLVDTYDAPGHPGDMMHVFALYLMQQNGVKLVRLVD